MRQERFAAELRRLIDEVAGIEIGADEGATTFLELGLDSLALTQVALQVQKVFSVKVTFRQLMETYATLDVLAEHMEKTTPPDALPSPQPGAAAAAPPTIVAAGPAAAPLAVGALPALP